MDKGLNLQTYIGYNKININNYKHYLGIQILILIQVL
jgi:hypothetical protein